MRIYLVGAQSTGKTTLVNYVSERYSINKIKEMARSVLIKYGNSLNDIRANLDISGSFQKDIIDEQIQQEHNTETPFICDRSLDIFAYTCLYTIDLNETLEKEYIKEYIRSFKDEDVIVIFLRPCEELMEDDGIRKDLNWETLMREDGMIKYILESFDISYISVDSKYLNERVRTIECILKLAGIR